MAKTVTVKLTERLIAHEREIAEITVKAPGLTLYQQHGDPFEWVPGADDKPVYVEDNQAIEAYMKACIVPPEDNPLLLNQVGLADSMALKDAVLGFFFEAKRALASRRSPTP